MTTSSPQSPRGSSCIRCPASRDRGSLAKDGRLDVLAMAVGYFSEAMARDTDKAHEEHLENLRDQALQDFMDLVHRNNGGSDMEVTWLN